MKPVAWIRSLRNRGSSAKRSPEGHFVRELQVASHRDPLRDLRHLDAEKVEATRDLHPRQLPLKARLKRKNDFTDRFTLNATDQRIDRQICGRNIIHRRYKASQHVVEAVILSGLLDLENLPRLSNNAENILISLRVATQRAKLLRREVETSSAPMNVRLDTTDGIGKLLHFHLRRIEQVECNSFRALLSDPRKRLQPINQCLQRRNQGITPGIP